jgi:hypothetical protein
MLSNYKYTDNDDEANFGNGDGAKIWGNKQHVID